MRNRLIELLSEGIRETKNLTKAVVRETAQISKSVEAAHRAADIAQKSVDIAQESAAEARRKADAAWELVIIARQEIHQPFWKR